MLRDERFYLNSYSDPAQRLIWEYTLRRTSTLYPVARRDPIFTPIFTAVLGSGGFAIGATTITYASIASAIATTALGILLTPTAPKPPKPEDGKVPKTQSIPYRAWAVGRMRVGGSYMLWEAKGRNLMAVQAVAGHRVSAYRGFWLHDNRIELSDLDVNGFTNFASGDRYGNNVRIMTRVGLPTETAYVPITDILSAEGIWTSAHRGDGQASIAMIVQSVDPQQQQKRFPYGAPVLSTELDGALCWDFRNPAQSPTNPATWTWTRNAALIMPWHQCFNEFGHKRDYTKAILPVLDIWKEEADVCDEDVPLAGGGTEKRYECNGYDTAENGPKVGTNAILAACDGWICERGDGALLFSVGKFRESRCGVLTDADIVGHQIQYDVLPEDAVNQLVPRFTYPPTDYTTSDTDFFEDVAAQVEYGRILRQEADYGWCHQWRQARRLGIRDWRRLQQKKRGSIDVRFSGINAIYSRWVRLVTPKRISSMNGAIVENRRSVLALMRGGFQMDIVKHPDNIDDWNPAVDEGAQPPVPDAPDAGELVVPVINVVQAKPSGGSVYIRVVIIDPADDSLTPVVRYRVVDNGSGSPGAWVEQEFPDATPGVPVVGFVELNTNVVPSDKELEVQVAFKVTGDQVSDWSVTANVTSTVDPVAPAALTAFTQNAAVPHLGNAVFSLTTPNDSHLKTVKLYRKASGSGINVAVDTPISTLTVAASATYGYTDGDTTRTNIVLNGDFPSALTSWTAGTGWAWASGAAKKTAGVASSLSQNAGQANLDVIRFSFDVSLRSAGQITPGLTGSPNLNGTAKTANGTYRERLTANSTGSIRFVTDATFDGAIDNVIAFKESVTCAPQGVWDYYAVPVNGSNVHGTPSGPVTVTVI